MFWIVAALSSTEPNPQLKTVLEIATF